MDVKFGGWLILASIGFLICFNDIRFRRISNTSCTLVLLFSLLLSDYDSPIAIYIFSVLIIVMLYALRIYGGGDAKLMLCFLPSVSSEYLPVSFIIIGLMGGLVAAIYGILSIIGKGEDLEKLPYGVAIVLGFTIGSAASL